MIVSYAASLLVGVSALAQAGLLTDAPAGASASVSASAPAAAAAGASANATAPAPASAASTIAASAPQIASQAGQQAAPPFAGDDPVAIRDALVKQPIPATRPSLRERIRKLVALPGHAAQYDKSLAEIGLDREVVFVVSVPYGVLYQSKTHELTVDADLSGDDLPGTILLKRSVKGQSGRNLVIAPEAKAKGYIQQIDRIELKANGESKTMIRGNFAVPQVTFAKAHGGFAVELRCGLTSPYLKDQHDHADPTDENPTDITTRTSTLYADVHEIWLVSPQSGTVLTKNLRLSK